MIVRILGGGQFEVPDSEMGALEELDAKLAAAIEGNDEEAFAAMLSTLAEKVRSTGTALDPVTIVSSDLTVPHEGASLEEVRHLLASEDAADD
jgi:hypothetical protein